MGESALDKKNLPAFCSAQGMKDGMPGAKAALKKTHSNYTLCPVILAHDTQFKLLLSVNSFQNWDVKIFIFY